MAGLRIRILVIKKPESSRRDYILFILQDRPGKNNQYCINSGQGIVVKLWTVRYIIFMKP